MCGVAVHRQRAVRCGAVEIPREGGRRSRRCQLCAIRTYSAQRQRLGQRCLYLCLLPAPRPLVRSSRTWLRCSRVGMLWQLLPSGVALAACLHQLSSSRPPRIIEGPRANSAALKLVRCRGHLQLQASLVISQSDVVGQAPRPVAAAAPTPPGSAPRPPPGWCLERWLGEQSGHLSRHSTTYRVESRQSAVLTRKQSTMGREGETEKCPQTWGAKDSPRACKRFISLQPMQYQAVNHSSVTEARPAACLVVGSCSPKRLYPTVHSHQPS